MERIHTELNKIYTADKPSIGFKLLLKTGLLEKTLPEMVALKGVEKKMELLIRTTFHTLEVLENV